MESKLNLPNNENNTIGGSDNLNIDSILNENKNTPQSYSDTLSKNVDPDLVIGYDVVKLPSEGRFYKNGLKEVEVEYLTSKDEDILSTPALIENGTVLDVILKRKIKTPDVNVDELLTGDKNAIVLFLRSSSYGADYDVEVLDPRNGKPFTCTVDLTKLKYKNIEKEPDYDNEFNVFIPMRKKNVKFKLLTAAEEKRILNNAEAMKEAYNQEYLEYSTLKLTTQITEIEGNRDKSYIKKFVEAMPARDSLTIRKEMLAVTPDLDMNYEFVTKDGFKFTAMLSLGVDFFFPNI
jgi:hypothetical protein